MKRMAVHNGIFHADDVFGVALMQSIYNDLEIIRTRDEELLKTCDIVSDVGNGKYDHHHVDKIRRENGIPYCGFGLLWRDFGISYINAKFPDLSNLKEQQEVAEKVDTILIQQIDAQDNGVDVMTSQVPIMTLCDIIYTFIPTGAGEDEIEKGFFEAVEFAKILERSGVDMIHVGQANHTGNMNDTIPAMGTQPYCFMSKYTKQIKEAVSIPVSSVGRIVTPENAEALIENGVCDIVGLGRSLLADPDYVKKLEAGEGRRIRHCMMCNKGCTDAIQNRKFLSCVLNAENGYEYERTITPSDEKKKVVVIGGGVAGMEAARVASVKGHEVVLFEKETTLGGQLNIASIPPRKSEMNRALRYLTNEMKELHVDLRLGRTADAEMILAENPDNVIVAAGAHNVIPPIEGSKMPHVFDAWKVLNHEELPSGRVVVIGGGLVGAETAELLAEMGCQVSVVEMMEEIAKEESKTVRPVLFESFEKYQVQLLTGTKVTAITANSVEAENAEGKVSLPCDYVVLAVGARPNLFDVQALEDKGVQVSFVGDCNERAADINRAVEEGYLAANVL